MKNILTFFTVLILGFAIFTGQAYAQARECVPENQCRDCKDNNGDKKADYDGNDTEGSGAYIEPDPSCFSTSAQNGIGRNGQPITEANDDVVSEIIPCTDKCTFSDIFRLLNNFLTFFITTLLIPIFIIILMTAGFKYITAEGNPAKIANLKKILGNLVLGIVLILCAWLIVNTIMTTLLNDEFKESGVEFLGN